MSQDEPQTPSARAEPEAVSLEPTTPGVPASGTHVPSWHLHRRMYDWVLSLAHHKHSTTALFLLSFSESSFFPIPPDVLQIALTLERRARAWWYAGVNTVGSVLGGVLGYLIGVWGWAAVGPFFFRHVPGFTPEHFETVKGLYAGHAFLAILTAAFTPIPYKVFTITAGVFGVPLWALVVGSVLGRGGRFYLVAAIFYLFGPPAKRFVERYFNLLTLVFIALLIGGVLVLKGVGGHEAEAPAGQTGTP